MTRAKNLSAATFSHPWLKILGRALGAGAEQEEATRPVFLQIPRAAFSKSRSVQEAASSVPETATELRSPQWHFVKEKAVCASSVPGVDKVATAGTGTEQEEELVRP